MFAKIENGQVVKFPYTFQDLHVDFPNVSFPANPSSSVLGEYGVVQVFSDPVPTHNPTTHKVKKKAPVKLNGRWVAEWEISQLDYERAASNIRAIRNDKLRDTDWTQGKDISDEVSQAWGAYRQALRDIPQQNGFPFNVVWPDVPAL